MDAPASPSEGGCFLRVLWFLVGPALLFVTSCLLLVEGKGWFGPIDVAHACVAALAVTARALDRASAEPGKVRRRRDRHRGRPVGGRARRETPDAIVGDPNGTPPRHGRRRVGLGRASVRPAPGLDAVLPLIAPHWWHRNHNKAIVEHSGIKMPSFFGCMRWSFCVLLPLYLVLTLIFFV